MPRRPLSALDRTFLAGETRESMMHVGVLVPFAPPETLPPADFLRSLVDELKQRPKAYPPWTLKLRHPELLASPLQSWVEDDEFDVDYHVRRSALPSPGDERELGILVSRLHSHKIDFHRPPWEVHFIEGLEGGRFAIYFKVHHALVDGFTGMRLLSRSLSTDASELDTPLFFSRPPHERAKREPPAATFDHLLHVVRDQASVTREVARAAMGLLRGARAKEHPLIAPLQAPRSVLNQKISRNRRFATQRFPIEGLRRVAHDHGGTLNDAVLAVTSGALRRFLLELGSLPREPMTAMVPVNVRPKGTTDAGGGNEVGAILASLATDLEDPHERLRAIVASTRRAKEQLQGMSKNAMMQYGALLLTPMLLSLVPGAVGRVRPAFNVVISNVPGPTKPVYFRGWRAEALYPVSIPFHGYGLNITVGSYAGELDFGFTGCRDTVPHLQRLAVYAGEAAEGLGV